MTEMDAPPSLTEESPKGPPPIKLDVQEVKGGSSSVGEVIIPTKATEVTNDTNTEEVIKADVLIANGVLRAVAAGWNKVASLSDIETLAGLTLNIVERRRKLLNQQHGPAQNTSKLNFNDYVA